MLPTKELWAKIQAGLIDMLQTLRSDIEFYSAVALKIRTKLGTLIPFRFNRCQQVLHLIAEDMLRDKGYVKIILLKFRQFGGSTYIGARIFWNTSMNPNQNSKIVAHTREAVVMLFGMQKRFFNNLDATLRPMKKYNTREELAFLNPTEDPKEFEDNPGLDSAIGVYSAKTSGAGRGGTIRHLHCSEVPFWFPKQKGKTEDTMLGLLNSVASEEDGKGTEVWIESTARGIGDYFYREYYKAKRGEGDFKAVFLPWYLMDEYADNSGGDFTPNEEERKLLEEDHPEWEYVNPQTKNKRLSLAQVKWRRRTIAVKCGGDEVKFRQEYPSTDYEAFITSGAPFFNLEHVHQRLQAVTGQIEPVFRGTVDILPSEQRKDQRQVARVLQRRKIKLVPNKYGNVDLWEHPKEEQRYVFFADVSEGVREGDYSVLYILSRNTGRMVAKYRGHIDPDEFGYLIYELAHYYNWAFGTPEANGFGFTTVSTLKMLAYPGLYERMQYEKFSPEGTKKAGWLTNHANRMDMLDAGKQCFRDDVVEINDPELLLEMSTLVRDPDTGKYEAQEGCFDDCVMAFCGACKMFFEIKAGRPRKTGLVTESADIEPKLRRDARRRRRAGTMDRYTGYQGLDDFSNRDEFDDVMTDIYDPSRTKGGH